MVAERMSEMIDIRMKYGAGIFVNAQDISPTPETMSVLMTLFQDKGLVPTVFYELRPAPGFPAQPRVSLASPNNEWAVSFASNRIDVIKNPTDPSGRNLGDLTGFSLQANDFFERLTDKFNKKANRLVIYSVSLLPEMTPEQLEKIYQHLFRPPQFYQEHAPFEWVWRAAARKSITIADREDILNVITTISRIRGVLGIETGISKFDRIQLAFDINTTDLDLEYRFDFTHMKSFLEQVTKIHESLSEDMQGYING